jgi:RND family efflux transporter MFP subunit
MATTTSEPLVKSRFVNEPNLAPAPRKRASGIRRLVIAMVILAMVGGGGWWTIASVPGLLGGGDEFKMHTEKVARNDLLITVVASGNVESASNVDIKCAVKGGSSILWIVPDGSEVKKGDKLVELDSSSIEEQVNQQKIVVERAIALKLQSEREYSAAKIAVQEYLDGTFLKELQAAEAQITIAMENMRSAENSYDHTARMARKGYVTPLQLDAQKFAVERAKLDLGTAETTKNVLVKYTKVKMLEDLESKRDTAEAKMRSETAACDLEASRLKKLETQLGQCLITAPQDGMVVFANEFSSSRGSSSQSVKIEEGAAVREQQSIVRLPDLSDMQVKVTVHESKVDSLSRGMRAHIRILDRVLQGEIVSIANQPEPTSFSSSSVKEYATIVKIDGEAEGLKPGMTAEVTILVADIKNAISVPVQAVVEQNGKFHCWVKKGHQTERRPVLIGMTNNTTIEIKDGLAEGDEVVINPRAVIPAAREESGSQEEVDVTAKFGKSSRPAGEVAGSSAPGGEGGKPSSSGRSGTSSLNLKDLDKDGDGKVSMEEAPERMRGFFDRIDTNSDGFIDNAEFLAMKKRAQQREQGGGPSGPGGGGPGGPPSVGGAR